MHFSYQFWLPNLSTPELMTWGVIEVARWQNFTRTKGWCVQGWSGNPSWMDLVCRLNFQTQNLALSWGYQISRVWCQTNVALNGILQRKSKVRSTMKYPGWYSNEFVFANTIDQSLLSQWPGQLSRQELVYLSKLKAIQNVFQIYYHW